METTFKLTATGVQPNQNQQTALDQLQTLLKGNPTEIQAAIRRIRMSQPVVLAENLPSAKANSLLKKLTDSGLACRLDPMQLGLVAIEEDAEASTYQCPACAHKQPPAFNSVDICERCGVVGRNYQEYSKNIANIRRVSN